MEVVYSTDLGTCYMGDSADLGQPTIHERLRGQVDLIFTSPPFPLNRKKKYGNLQGEEYLEWLAGFAPVFRDLLSPTGSIVIEMGNAWEPRRPEMSILPLRALLRFLDEGRLVLCQQFVWSNPARLPSPAQWVNIERIRVKDAFTHIWWMSSTSRPKADNTRVLNEYSESMKVLLNKKKYNAGLRPSQHNIGQTSFLTEHRGSIPSNVITAANTAATSPYIRYCREEDLPLHPARMPIDVATFFVEFLTEPGDLVLDPFAGSNTTGEAAELANRRWIAIEADSVYAEGSIGRFQNASGLVKY